MAAVVQKLSPSAELYYHCTEFQFIHYTEKLHTVIRTILLKAEGLIICSSGTPDTISQLAVWLFPTYHFSMYCYFMSFQFDECIFLSFLCTSDFAWVCFFFPCQMSLFHMTLHSIYFAVFSCTIPDEPFRCWHQGKHSELNFSCITDSTD